VDAPRDEKEELMSEKPERPRTRPYSVEEAAEKAGVDDKTIRKEIERGKVIAIRMGRRILIPCGPFDRLIEQGQ
jgi:excisionase family DNA binding protein